MHLLSVPAWLRSGLAFAVIPVALLRGLAVWARSGDRRKAANRMISFWADTGSRVAGVKIQVVGAHHLEAARPAVLVFNHQSAADILVMCMLIRRDFTAVAKQELRRNPLLGPCFAFAGVVFLDRFNTERAVAALQPAVETLHSGLSIAVAPEGTRSADERTGPFKKGAFRLAMAAKVPIVPIVIENAGDVMAPRSLRVRPGTVRMVVHEPIPTGGWTLDGLDEHIALVRQLYVDAIGSL